MFHKRTKLEKESIQKERDIIKAKKLEIKAAKKQITKHKTNRITSNEHGNNFGRLMDYFFWNKKGQPSNADYKNPNMIKESIYPKGQSLGKYCKRFNWIHRFFKLIIFYPALRIMDKLIGNRLDKGVEDTWYNKNLLMLDKSWKEAMGIMAKYMRPQLPSSPTYELVRKMMLTFILNDSITREFTNCLMHSITKNMQEQYKGKGEVYHIFYTDTVSYNPVYFTMVKAVMEQNKHPADVQIDALNKQDKALKKDRAKVIEQKHNIYMQKKAEEEHKKKDKEKGKSVFEPITANPKDEPIAAIVEQI